MTIAKYDNWQLKTAWLNYAPKTTTTEVRLVMSSKFWLSSSRRLCQFTLDLWAGKGFNFLENINWQELRTELKRGNNDMLSIFFRKHWRYCIRRLTKENQCSREDAEDIFIESVMNLREKLIQGSLDAVTNVRSYLFKTCHYMLMDRIRKAERQDQRTEDLARFFYESHHSDENMDYDPDLLEITRKAWQQLSENCKDILHYFYVDRLDMKEIAVLMELASPEVAKTTKSRCFKKFSTLAYELQESQSSK